METSRPIRCVFYTTSQLHRVRAVLTPHPSVALCRHRAALPNFTHQACQQQLPAVHDTKINGIHSTQKDHHLSEIMSLQYACTTLTMQLECLEPSLLLCCTKHSMCFGTAESAAAQNLVLLPDSTVAAPARPDHHIHATSSQSRIYRYAIGPSKLPSANCLTIGSSVVSNSAVVPSQTTRP